MAYSYRLESGTEHAVAWYRSKKGWASVVAGTIYALNYWGHFSSAREIYGVIKVHWSAIVPFLPFALFALAVVFFEQERRKSKHPDPNTLKSRTLKLRDEIQAFLDSVPIASDSISQSNRKDDILQSSGSGLRVDRLHHGYELRFAAPVARIFNEFGERGLRDILLAHGMGRQVNDEEWYRIVIARLTKLAERPEAEI